MLNSDDGLEWAGVFANEEWVEALERGGILSWEGWVYEFVTEFEDIWRVWELCDAR